MNTVDFLFEIGCEELPPKTLIKLAEGLSAQIIKNLQQATLDFQHIKYFATPRRLAVLITKLATSQPSQTIVRQGPSVEKAFDKSGTPTLACIGFARSCGVSADQLKSKMTDKGERIFCETQQKGELSVTLMPAIIAKAIENLPISKPMRWGSSEKPFIRPVKWVVMMQNSEIIPAKFFGKKTSANTYGHRFHHPGVIQIPTAIKYEEVLKDQGRVLPDFESRKKEILAQIKTVCNPYGKPLLDENLLEEVTALVEYPVVLVGQFNHSFLKVPSEALITAMKVHQKCFPIVGENGKLLPYFILVSNIQSKNPQKVIEGNERVINARLSDAAFFFDKDLSHPLNFFTEKLSHVVFQHALGTLFDRTNRLSQLSQFIAKKLNFDVSLSKCAAELSKFDLMTEMVVEFPELQGIMGYYYAKHASVPEEVALSIKEHYYPRFSGDKLPQGMLSAIIALADRLDLIIGILGINKAPTGEKDPYALKRAALGIVRILIEKALPLDLMQLLQACYGGFESLANKEVIKQAYHFIIERMRSWYLEQGVTPGLFAAVIAVNATIPLDFDQRIKAVQNFQLLPESNSLSAANKRVSNILKKHGETDSSQHIDENLFESDTEKKFASLLKEKATSINNLYKHANYTEALLALATLKKPVDHFFDEVMIMVDDKKVRQNRLALLRALHHLFTQVADISLLS